MKPFQGLEVRVALTRATIFKMKKFSTLYKRTNTGAIQIWYLQQDKDKYCSTSGQIDGLKVTSEFTQCFPKNIGKKNETTGEQQALIEINNKYKKQLKSGYFENIEDIDNKTFFHPMLAKEFKDYKDKLNWKEGIGVQIKYNGGRLIATKDGLFTRKGEKYLSIPHIENALKPFFKKFPKAILDGEGFNYELREKLNEIRSLMAKKVDISQQDLDKSKELIRFYIYDGFNFEECDTWTDINSDYLRRKEVIDMRFGTWYGNGIIEKVPTWIVYSEKELEELYLKFLDEKHEGAILRILNKPYENKRTKFLLKYKPVDDAEFLVLDIIEGEGNRAGMAGKFICKFKDGRKFGASMKGNEEQFKEVWENKKDYIGKIVTIYYNGFTGKGLPNYARFDCNNWKKD